MMNRSNFNVAQTSHEKAYYGEKEDLIAHGEHVEPHRQSTSLQ